MVTFVVVVVVSSMNESSAVAAVGNVEGSRIRVVVVFVVVVLDDVDWGSWTITSVLVGMVIGYGFDHRFAGAG